MKYKGPLAIMGNSAQALSRMMRSLAVAFLAIGGLIAGTPAHGAVPAEFTVWRPPTGVFYSETLAGAATATQWGESTDIPVVGDFDGDGKKDIAVWRPSNGFWYIIQSSNGEVVTHQWGASTDVPVVGDFDGDGKADIAVWRPSTGFWYIIQSSNGQVVTHQWGAPGDMPVIGDFDGDGKTDIAVWRPSTGFWYIVLSSSNNTVAKFWGASTDMPVAGDFDGDGKTDIAVWRPSTGIWYIIQSSNNAVVPKQWGEAGDIPVPQDYDGDGKTDIAVWRPSSGFWYVVESSNGATIARQWGAATDLPENGSVEPLVVSIQNCALSGTIGYVAPAAYVPPAGATCNVSDLTTLASCVAAVRSGTIANIQFTTMLNCSGNETCLLDLSNVQGPVTLFGAPGAASGFGRTDTYTYPILNISQASNITVANLTFNEGPADTACTPYESNGAYIYPCESTISIDNSANIVLEQVSVLNSKDHGVAVSATQGVTIQDSTIQNSGVFGIWSGGSQSSDVSITNDVIQDSQSNGIYLSFTQGAVIQRNTLQHNHRVALFDECGGLCPGGQIDMLNNKTLQIKSNLIIDGQIDLNNATGQTDGIEIDESNSGVTITNNSIGNNLGAGIGADPGTTATNFQITGNKLYGNGVNFYGLGGTGIQESGDCVSH